MKPSDNVIQQLAEQAKRGEQAAVDRLLDLLKDRVKYRARAYYLVGGETEDLIQEGMIGLYKAIRDYNPEKGRFSGFASLCIDRQISSAVKKSLREKQRPLNEYISLNYSDEGDGGLIDRLVSNRTQNPQDIIEMQEEYQRIRQVIEQRFSGLERNVFGLFLQGLSYQEIAAKITKPVKAVDNTVQRIRRKLSGGEK